MISRRTVPAGTIISTPVRNYREQELGKIEDVMINTVDGTVAYLVLSYGGIFGTTLADKRFAVPFRAFTVDCSNEDEVVYRLDVAKETLETAPGFDKDRYPDFASAQFIQSIDQYYSNVPRKAA